MAFDFYLDKERTFIDHHEEGLFELINDDEKYPRLNWLWENFYNGPEIDPAVANELVHELIALRQNLVGKTDYKYVLHTIDRILPFISKAYTRDKSIKCMSD